MPQVLLVSGHASGAVRVWELKSQLGGEAAAGRCVHYSRAGAGYPAVGCPVVMPAQCCVLEFAAVPPYSTGGVHFALTKSLGGMHAAPVTAAALLDG